jgi:prepilin-type N-terminal cleavage/methylation domain-containing protein/prepilin-type processing-associated H-X9-DG protein
MAVFTSSNALCCRCAYVGAASRAAQGSPRGHVGRDGFTPVELPFDRLRVVSKRKRRAFTLVELLVVITIIGMLVALLLPAVQNTTNVSRQTSCANNMRQLALAAIVYDTSRGKLPGYSQRVPRSRTQAVGLTRTSDPPRWALVSVDTAKAVPISWAAMLLPHLERQDIWDQVVDVHLEPEIRRLDVFVCPSDSEALVMPDLPALSYSVNAGAPDWDGRFLIGRNIGDTTANGLFLNLFEFAWNGVKPPTSRLGSIRDGAATTIMLSENVHKSYEPAEPGFPSRFSWTFGTEQHLGIVWVVNENPQPGSTYIDQERINRAGDDVYDNDPEFDPNLPRFARPASAHGAGVNVAFCDGHIEFLRDDIDYTVYQQLLTANGRKCVDPRDHDAGVNPPDATYPIQKFRRTPPLTADDYQ